MYAYHVVPYAPEHRDELRAVCLAQAGEHVSASEAHRRFTLLMYCDAYLERGVAYTLLDERAVGFYEHMGFERLGEYDDGAGVTFCMRLGD